MVRVERQPARPDGAPGCILSTEGRTMPDRARASERPCRSRHVVTILLSLGLSVGALISPTQVRAESPADRIRALRLQAEAAYAGHHPLEALAAWRAAWELQPSYEIACNIGRVALRDGSPIEAATFLSRCSRMAKEPKTPDEEARRATERAELVEARAKVVALRIVVNNPGAAVVVDGAPVGVAPLEDDVFVGPGAHQVTAQLEGFSPAARPIRAEVGETRLVTLNLAKDAPAPSAASPAKGRRGVPWAAIGTGAAALVGIGLGAGFSVASNAASADVDSTIPSLRDQGSPCVGYGLSSACDQYLDASQSQETFRGLAIGGFVGAGLAGVATGILLLYPKAPVKPATHGGGGIMVSLW